MAKLTWRRSPSLGAHYRHQAWPFGPPASRDGEREGRACRGRRDWRVVCVGGGGRTRHGWLSAPGVFPQRDTRHCWNDCQGPARPRHPLHRQHLHVLPALAWQLQTHQSTPDSTATLRRGTLSAVLTSCGQAADGGCLWSGAKMLISLPRLAFSGSSILNLAGSSQAVW